MSIFVGTLQSRLHGYHFAKPPQCVRNSSATLGFVAQPRPQQLRNLRTSKQPGRDTSTQTPVSVRSEACMPMWKRYIRDPLMACRPGRGPTGMIQFQTHTHG